MSGAFAVYEGGRRGRGTSVSVVFVLGGKPVPGTGSGKFRGLFPATSAGSGDANSCILAN